MSSPSIHLLTTFKNEGPYLIEWIAYYQSIGISDFTIFSNDCTDLSDHMLDRLAKMGVIRHFDNPVKAGKSPQRRAYSRANKMDHIKNADYLVVVDGDEFLNIKIGNGHLETLIDACDAPDAISLGWRLMGSNAQKHWEDDFVVSRFTKGVDFKIQKGMYRRGYKTIFRPEKFDYFGIHKPKFNHEIENRAEKINWRDGSGNKILPEIFLEKWAFEQNANFHNYGYINHYAIKSKEEFLLKILRGRANSVQPEKQINFDYWNKYNINETYDDKPPHIAHEHINELLSDPELKSLRSECIRLSKEIVQSELTKPHIRAFLDHS